MAITDLFPWKLITYNPYVLNIISYIVLLNVNCDLPYMNLIDPNEENSCSYSWL